MIVRSVYHEGAIAESRKYWFYFVASPGYLFLDFVTVPRFFPNVSVNICLENNTSTPQRAFPLELQIVKVLNCHECDIVGTVGSALSGHGGETLCLWPPQPWQWAHLLAARGQPKNQFTLSTLIFCCKCHQSPHTIAFDWDFFSFEGIKLQFFLPWNKAPLYVIKIHYTS